MSTNYDKLAEEIKVGESILIDDGVIELKVTAINGKEIVNEVIHGGPVKSRKGMNLPDTIISAPSLTEKDIEDLVEALEGYT